uniref:Er-8 pheromone n=1 Tax=Euplotes raikovi TaxID=5938 RepID=A0A346CI60_EUPRA|nr:Er-8 pheromone [Euplotes raikovi]
MNKLAILAIIAMVLLSANAFRFQSRLRSNVEASTRTQMTCVQAMESCEVAMCGVCEGGEYMTCYYITTDPECGS